jgi:hypothetical protein
MAQAVGAAIFMAASVLLGAGIAMLADRAAPRR